MGEGVAVEEDLLQWHRWFGLGLTDLLVGRPYTVDMERDLSVKKQLLDVVIVCRDTDIPEPDDLPDGLDGLREHNLITFKSFHEALDAEALVELVGHLSSYRKLVGGRDRGQLPMDRCRLYAVCVRSPQELLAEPRLARAGAGVYDLPMMARLSVRLVVIHELPETPKNALLHMFAFQERRARYGAEHYRPRSIHTSSFMDQLARRYSQEGWNMPFTVEEFNRQLFDEFLREMPEEKKLEIAAGLPPEKRLAGLSLDDLLKALPPEAVAELKRRLGGG